jgi:hypothetical protein
VTKINDVIATVEAQMDTSLEWIKWENIPSFVTPIIFSRILKMGPPHKVVNKIKVIRRLEWFIKMAGLDFRMVEIRTEWLVKFSRLLVRDIRMVARIPDCCLKKVLDWLEKGLRMVGDDS